MRLFYAALVSAATVDDLSRIQNELQTAGVRGRLIPRQNLHLTLHFLGETGSEELPHLKGALDSVAHHFISAPVRLTRPGFFRQGRGLLIYAGVDDSEGRYATAARRLRELSGRGERRRFKPHITLMRNAEVPGKVGRELFSRPFNYPSRPVQALALMESLPGRGGVEYKPLHVIQIGS